MSKTLLMWALILSACQYSDNKKSIPPANNTKPQFYSFKEGVPPVPSFSLKFINEQILNPTGFYQNAAFKTSDHSTEHTKPENANQISKSKGLHFRNIPIGGLSALAYDSNNKVFLALSDDKGHKGWPPRFYKFQLLSKKKPYSLKLIDQVILRDSKGQPWTPIDPEGMAILDNKRVLISSEGAQMPALLAPPQVFMFSIAGQGLFSFPVWDIFWQAHQVGKWGVKENKAFESLSIDPKRKYIYLAGEASLHQDDSPFWLAKNQQAIRITRWDMKNKDRFLKKIKAHKKSLALAPKQNISEFTKYQQYIYIMDSEVQKNNMKGVNGLTDFIALGDQQLLTLERAYLKKPDKKKPKKLDANLVRLFLTDCSQASDIAQYKQLSLPSIHLKKTKRSIHKKTFVSCGKTLIADLSQVHMLKDTHKNTKQKKQSTTQKQRAKSQSIKVDNIEGIALGPEVSKGKYLLVLVSDNNFSKKQKNQFLFFHFLQRATFKRKE